MGSAQGGRPSPGSACAEARVPGPAGERAQLVLRVGWAEGPGSAALLEPPRLWAEPREEARSGLALPAEFPVCKMPKKKPTPIQLNPAPDGSAVNGTSSAE